MAQGIKILYEGGVGELEEKKSRFIATTLPISSQEEALAFIEKTKKQYWDARHNCYAYVLGDHHEIQRFSDDGEPGGTAGKPMLEYQSIMRGSADSLPGAPPKIRCGWRRI